MNSNVSETDHADLVTVRSTKRATILDSGISPYPVTVPRTHTLGQIREIYTDLETGAHSGDVVSVTGRVMFIRTAGKLSFGVLQEGDGTRLQVMISRNEVGEDSLAGWKTLVDIGDHVSVTGEVISSFRGELSVLASSWVMASKGIRPLPNLHDDLREETRVRFPYLDLIVRDEARAMVAAKSRILHAIRTTLFDDGYTEVETPVLQRVHGGAAARPFKTHMNAFDQPMSLRIALELNLKKAVVGGIDRVYEMGRTFRNEGVDTSHSPEFTMLEAYQAYGDQFTVAELTREVILAAADAAGSRTIETAAGTVDLDGEWEWVSFYDALSEAVCEVVDVNTSRQVLTRLAVENNVAVNPAWDATKIAMELVGELVEPTLVQPTFLYDFPAAAQPLARRHRNTPGLIEAWDLFIGGMERATGFSELVDPVVQREIMVAQSLQAADGDPEAMQLDEEFLMALEYGAPPMGGLGIGVDRLIMLLTGGNIREVTLFPHIRAEGE